MIDLVESDVNAIESFLNLAVYNGYIRDVFDILNALSESLESYLKKKGVKERCRCGISVSRPHNWTGNKVDEFGGIFWSWLVLQYGEFGTSPRYGWIYYTEALQIYEIIKKFLEEEEIDNGQY